MSIETHNLDSAGSTPAPATTPSAAQLAARRAAKRDEMRRYRANVRARKALSATPTAAPTALQAETLPTAPKTVEIKSQQAEETGLSVVQGSPMRARGAGFPLVKVRSCPPCTDAQFQGFCGRYIRGELVEDALKAEGIDCWAAVSLCGETKENREEWLEVQRLRQSRNAAAVEDAGLAMLQVSRGKVPMTEEETDTPAGHISKRVVTRSPAALDSASGKIMPATHGRQAGRNTQAVQVNLYALGQRPPNAEDY